MKIKTCLVCLLAVALLIAGIALATPVVGLNFANILASGAINSEVFARAKVALPQSSSQEDDEWTAKLLTTGPTAFIVQDVS